MNYLKVVLLWGSKWAGFTLTMILFYCYTDWPLVLNRQADVTVQVVAWWSKPLLLSCPSPSIIVSLVTALLWEAACHVASPPGGRLLLHACSQLLTVHCLKPHIWMCCVNIAWDTMAYFHLFINRWRVKYKLGLYTSFPVLELIWFFFLFVC